MNRVTGRVVVVLIATARLAAAQGAQGAPTAKIAKEFQPPRQGFAIVHRGHGAPLVYASCQVSYAWTRRQPDGTVIASGVEHRELDTGQLYDLDVSLVGLLPGETRRSWTGTQIVDIAVQQARCPSLPNRLRIEPGAVIRDGVRGELDLAPPGGGGVPVVRTVKLSGAAVVVDYFMSESLEAWTEQYPMPQIEARLAQAQAELDRKAGRTAEALRGFQRALALEPGLPAAAVAVAELLLAAHKADDAFAAVAEVARARPAWLYRQVIERPALAALGDLPALQTARATHGDARWSGGTFTIAYSRAIDTFAVRQSTDVDGNGGGSWVDFIGPDGRPQTRIGLISCAGMDCPVSPQDVEFLDRMLADLGFTTGEPGQNAATDSALGCRYRFPSVHVGVVCGKDQVRVVQQNTVLIERPLQGYHYTYAARFPGIVALGTWTDGYGHQTITGVQVLRSPAIP